MFKVVIHADQAIKKVKTRARNIKNLNAFFMKKKRPYFIQAFAELQREVYIAHGFPKVYERTYNTLKSLDVETFSGKGVSGMQIFLNPSKADIQDDELGQLWRGSTSPYYPVSVLMGQWTWRPEDAGPRDFLLKWSLTIGPRFIQEFGREFKKAIGAN